MKAVSYRLNEDVIALINTLKIRGFGTSSADVVRKAVCFMAASDPGDVAKEWVGWLDRMNEAAVPEPVVVQIVEPQPIPTPGCVECGAPFAKGNDRFCDAHVPSLDDAF